MGPVLVLSTAPASPAAVTPPILAAVLAAALLHAIWNSLAHSVPDRLVGFGLIGLVSAVIGAALVVVSPALPAGVWWFVAASAALHVVYNLLLLASYQLGEFSQTYPLARGTAPLVVTAVSVLVLHKGLPGAELAGVLAICAGLIALVLVGGPPGRAQLPALGCAMLTGLMIAGYTVVDGLAVVRSPLGSYVGWLFLCQGLPTALLPLARGRSLRSRLPGSALRGCVGGLVSFLAYAAVLWAQTSGALAPIAALRETSIVFGALIGTVFLGERLGYRRAGAAAVVLAGVLLISLPG
jgi:drug/metabolite transporter (DMT)-like permease